MCNLLCCKMFQKQAYLLVDFCATIDIDMEVVSLGECPYHGFWIMFSARYNNRLYIQLPDNVSELNDYTCVGLWIERAHCAVSARKDMDWLQLQSVFNISSVPSVLVLGMEYHFFYFENFTTDCALSGNSPVRNQHHFRFHHLLYLLQPANCHHLWSCVWWK